MKNIINPSAIFYIAIIVAITILIGFVAGNDNKKDSGSEVKIIKENIVGLKD
jgi:hypothetical protein